MTNSETESSSENESRFDFDISQGTCKHDIETWDPEFSAKMFNNKIGEQKLFLGSDKSVLCAIGERFATYTNTNVSKGTMTKLLEIEKETLPQPNLLPKSYYEAKKLIQEFLLPVRKYDVCINHCAVYRNISEGKLYRDLEECPVCNTPRYTATGRPKRQIKYIPIGPRLERIFGNVSLAAMLQTEIPAYNGNIALRDIQDSSEFLKLFRKDGFFEGDTNGIVIGLEADGVAPYHSFNQTYSFTVVTVPFFNLIRKVRMLFRNIFVIMIIPGDEKSEASSQDTYFEILVDELLYLTQYSYVKDYQGAPIKLKIKLLLYILDYPGFCKTFHLSGSGAFHGCIWCHITGIHCKHLYKTVYLRNRSYLAEGHQLKIITGFPLATEVADKPKMRTEKEYSSYAKAFKRAKNKAQATSIASATGCKGPSPLTRLPGYNRPLESNPDGMHTIQRCMLNIHNLITGKEDSQKVRLQEKEFNRFQEIWPVEYWNIEQHEQVRPKNPKKRKSNQPVSNTQSALTQEGEKVVSCTKLPHPPYVIKDISLCNDRFGKLRFPFGAAIKKSPIFSTTTALKSHDWKELACRGILKYCLRNQLGLSQEQTLFQFYDCLARLFAEEHQINDLDKLAEDLNTVLALIERNFPVSIQNITQHLLHHIIDGIRRYGPLYSTWMFGFERLNGWISKRAINKRHPESTIIETYLLYDFSQFLAATRVIDIKFLESSDLTGDLALDDESNCKTKQIQLNEELLNDIFVIQCTKIPELNMLWEMYMTERKNTRNFIPFEEWQPRGRSLTQREAILTKPLDATAKVLRKYHLTNDYTGRVTIFSAASAATGNRDSSIISLNLEKGNFGKIVKILINSSYNVEHVYCIVEVLDVELHIATGLYKCKALTGTIKKLVEIKSLSSPLVYAQDEEGFWIMY